MKKNIWIWNHHATNMYFNKGGRHYWFAENLLKEGYNPIIFCASTRHGSKENIDTNGKKHRIKETDNIPFVFVRTPQYKKNNINRVLNMYSFYWNLFSVSRAISSSHGKPDIILASSVHPLTMVAGIKIAKKSGIPCICEVRDLWPESLVAYGYLNRKNILTRLLYQGEKWIYKRADSVIMTWEGGKDYIIDQGWDNTIDTSKIYHITNGVSIETFDNNSTNHKLEDKDLNNPDYKNFVYTGAIRKVNDLDMLIDAAKIIKNQKFNNIRFLLYGSGDFVEPLKKKCAEEEIDNAIFKGRVDKKYIPSILTSSYANILQYKSTCLDKYGQSQNKLFEYLASGRCIIQTYKPNYSICDKYKCGYSISSQTPEEIANTIIKASKNEEDTKIMGENARKAAYDFDFKKHTEKLIDIIEKL